MEEGIPPSSWQTQQIDQVIGEYPKVFAEAPRTAWEVVNHIMTLPGVIVHSPSHPTPLTLQDTIEREVKTMLKLGVFEPSESPWGSPPVLVPKPDGTVCFCIDVSRLNAVSSFDAYLMPRVDSLINWVRGAAYLSTIDLAKGYWQILLDREAREKNGPCGSFRSVSVYRNALWAPRGGRLLPTAYGQNPQGSIGLCGCLHR